MGASHTGLLLQGETCCSAKSDANEYIHDVSIPVLDGVDIEVKSTASSTPALSSMQETALASMKARKRPHLARKALQAIETLPQPTLDCQIRDGCIATPGTSQAETRSEKNLKLLKAARDGDLKALDDLLEDGAYLETRRPFVMMPQGRPQLDHEQCKQMRGRGLTPLMYASQGGYLECVQSLLVANADVRAADEDGTMALHFACGADEPEVARTLIRAGADQTAADDNGNVPARYLPETALRTRQDRTTWDEVFREKPEIIPAERDSAAVINEVSASREHTDVLDMLVATEGSNNAPRKSSLKNPGRAVTRTV